MKKVFLIVLVLTPFFALAHGGVDEKFVIRMTDNGFEPQELSIIEGDVVVFVNDDDVDRWPASNLHPTHGLYPEFDPQKGMKPGDSWSFTFNKAGTWRMHDHLIPSMTGTIAVLSDPDTEELTLEKSGPKGFFGSIKAFLNTLFGKLF